MTSSTRKAILAVAIALFAFSALAVAAAPPVKAATQLFSDDFEADALGALPAGWTPIAGSGWQVQADGSHVLAQTTTSTANAYTITAGSASWTDYTFQVSVKPGANDLNQATVVMGRFVDNNDHYSCLLKNHSEWYLGKKVGGIWSTLAQGSYSYSSQFYTVALTMQGSTISCSLNGVTLATRTDTALSHGMIGVSTKATSEFDNVLVTSGAASPTPTPTPTTTATATATPSPTATATATPAPTATATATPAPTATSTPTPPAQTTLFSDDFEADALGALPAGWTPIAGSGWQVQADGSHVLAQTTTSTANAYTITAGSATWTDYTFQVSVKPGANNLNQATVVMGRFVDNNDHYSCLLKNHSEWYLGKKVGGIWSTLAQGSYSYSSQFYTVALTMQNSTISCSLNGVTLATRTDTALSHGMIGVSTKATSEFDNVLVTSGTASPTPTPTPTSAPTPTPTPSPTPPPGSGAAAQLSVTTSSSGVTVQSEDANLNGWRVFFKSSAGGVISNDGEIDHGVYTELEAQNVTHGRIQMYFLTNTAVWIGNLYSAATITVLRNTPALVELQVVSTNTTYKVQWNTTYFIWPDGAMYVQLQATNIGSTALGLATSDGMEIDLGGLALAYYQNQAPYAWYVNGATATSPAPTSTVNVEATLFAHMTTVTSPPDMGVLLDKYTTWSSQGATSAGIVEAQNTARVKDRWLANLARVNPGQTLTFLFLFDQRRSLTQAQSIAMDADYRIPAVSVSTGTLATSDNEPPGITLSNGFNRNLGAYVIAANNNHVNATLGFPSGVSTRFAPRFKITGWTGGAPTVTWGGQALASGDGYTYTIDTTTHTLYVQLTFDVVAANAQPGQRANAALDIS